MFRLGDSLASFFLLFVMFFYLLLSGWTHVSDVMLVQVQELVKSHVVDDFFNLDLVLLLPSLPRAELNMILVTYQRPGMYLTFWGSKRMPSCGWYSGMHSTFSLSVPLPSFAYTILKTTHSFYNLQDRLFRHCDVYKVTVLEFLPSDSCMFVQFSLIVRWSLLSTLSPPK